MKLLLSIFSLILLTMAPMKAHVRSAEEEAFYNNCYNAYNTYATELDYETNNYSILILVGDYDSNVSYSVFFEQNEENNYKLFITVGDNKGYYPSTDLKGGCSVYDLKSTSVIKIEVHQENTPIYYYELKTITNVDYQETYKDKVIIGNNKGFKAIDDKNNESKETTPLVFTLSIVFTVVIVGSIIVLLVFYSRKKGLFNQENIDKEFKDEHEMRETIKDYISRFDEDNIEVEAEEKDEIVQKAEADTADLIKKIEKAKEDVEEKLADISAEDIEAVKEKMAKEEDEAKETPDIGTTIEKIKQASEAKEEVKTELSEAPKAEEASEIAEDSYHDDLHILLNKEEPVEVDESPENDFVTINSEKEEKPSTGNELINSAIKSIRNFRKANAPQQPVVVETKMDIVPEDYAQDLGDGIEYIGDTITITPIHEEERNLAKTQPNDDVDKIYKKINKESYNKTDDEELSDSFEYVTDEMLFS